MVESLMTAEEEFDTDIIISYSDIIFEKSLLKKMIQVSDFDPFHKKDVPVPDATSFQENADADRRRCCCFLWRYYL